MEAGLRDCCRSGELKTWSALFDKADTSTVRIGKVCDRLASSHPQASHLRHIWDERRG